MKTWSGLCGLPALVLVAACATQAPSTQAPAAPVQDNKEKTYEITKVTFVYEDIHPSFWSSSRTDSMFLSVFIYFKREIPTKQDIKEMRIYDESKRYWTMSVNEYVAEDKTYIGGYARFRTDHYSLNWSVLSLAAYEMQLSMINGTVCVYRYDPADPEPNGKNSRSYVYSSDYAGRKDDRYIQNVKRAEIRESRIEGDLIELAFSIADDRAANGNVAFYDKDKKFVGETARFKNIHSLEVRKFLNEGAVFNVDGRENRAKIAKGDITYQAGRSFSDIAYVMVSLSCNDPEREADQDVTIFRSKSELALLVGMKQGQTAPVRRGVQSAAAPHWRASMQKSSPRLLQ